MFKPLFILSVLSLPLLATAQSYDRPDRGDRNHDSRTIDRDLLMTSSNLSRELDRNLRFMNASEKQETLRLMNDALAVVRGQGYLAPVVISATLGGQGLVLESLPSLLETQKACIPQMSRVSRSNTDNASVSVNGITTSARTSGWWTNSAQKCNVVLSLALESAFRGNITIFNSRYVMNGFAGGQGVVAEGNTVAELEESCKRTFNMTGSVDAMTIQLNGGAKKSTRTSGWWTNVEQVCSRAIALAFQ